MAKDNKKGFILPPVTTDKRKCVQIFIPDEVYDRGAFWGALWELTFSYNWQLGSPEYARNHADLWREIWMNAYERSNGVDCCNDQVILHRFDPDTGRPQVSYNDGSTWQEDPADIQNQIPLQPPLVTTGGSKTKCDAATNGSQHVNELITATGENLTAASDVFALAVGIAEAVLGLFLIIVSAGTLTAPVTAVATAIWVAATSLFALGIDAYNAYWTTDKQDAILCAIFCNIGEDGQFTEEQYQAFRTKIYSTLPASPALDIVMTAINAGGARGLSQMCSYGNAALSDCDSCNCGGGCPNTWQVYPNSPNYFGVIVHQTPNYIIAKTDVINTNGIYYTYLTSVDNAHCCVINHTTYVLNTTDEALMTYENMLANGEQVGNFGADCGSAIPTEALGPKATDNCMNQVQFQRGVPFAIMYLKDACAP